MKSVKYRKWRFSKRLFPTFIARSGQGGGSLVIGRDDARKALRQSLGRDVSHMVEGDTMGEWIFQELLKEKDND